MREFIVVFARAPVPGQVKSRLARSLGDEMAAAVYAAMLRDSLVLAEQAARCRNDCAVVLSYTPHDAFEAGPYSLRAFWHGRRLPQCEGDLGDRMLDCLRRLQTQGATRIVVIGSDSPDLPPALICHAFMELERPKWVPSSGEAPVCCCDLVLSPTHDGGFCLIGTGREVPEALFARVEWSTDQTAAQVIHKAQHLNLRVVSLPQWHDVDTVSDFAHIGQPFLGQPTFAPETWRCLRSKNLL